MKSIPKAAKLIDLVEGRLRDEHNNNPLYGKLVRIEVYEAPTKTIKRSLSVLYADNQLIKISSHQGRNYDSGEYESRCFRRYLNNEVVFLPCSVNALYFVDTIPLSLRL